MALSYLDSSALLKRYLLESGSRWITGFFETETVAISRLTVAEIASALARRLREGSITAEERQRLYEEFLQQARGYIVVELTRAVVQQAAALLLDPSVPGRLRTLDALHITSARTVFERAGQRGEAIGAFVSADRALLAAARWAGLTAINPEDYP